MRDWHQCLFFRRIDASIATQPGPRCRKCGENVAIVNGEEPETPDLQGGVPENGFCNISIWLTRSVEVGFFQFGNSLQPLRVILGKMASDAASPYRSSARFHFLESLTKGMLGLSCYVSSSDRGGGRSGVTRRKAREWVNKCCHAVDVDSGNPACADGAWWMSVDGHQAKLQKFLSTI